MIKVSWLSGASIIASVVLLAVMAMTESSKD
jgi:hypothetical protein